MKRIYKYNLSIRPGEQVIIMPEDAQIISAQVQNGELKMWAVVDPMEELEERTIIVFGTGWNMPDLNTMLCYDHIGTVQMRDGLLVWHIFEIC